VSVDDRLTRPPTPIGSDPSRAAERASVPTGWRFAEPETAAVHGVIAECRGIRRFRSDEVPEDLLSPVLQSQSHRAPSVGLMQPCGSSS